MVTCCPGVLTAAYLFRLVAEGVTNPLMAAAEQFNELFLPGQPEFVSAHIR
jgi:hypothetical protein